MNAVDLSQTIVEGGFFVNCGKRPAPFQWSTANSDSWRFVGTFCDSGAPLREDLISLFDQAEECIFVASFLISDVPVIDALIRAADRLRGGVYVITSLDEKTLTRGIGQEDELEDVPSEERTKNFRRLTTGGVYVRGHANCHAKIAIVDRSTALIGSANFNRRGFEYTNEAGVIVSDPPVVEDATRLFSELWHEGCGWEIPPGRRYTVSERREFFPSPLPVARHDRSGDRLVWTNESKSRSLLTAIHDVVDSSRLHLTLSSFSFVGMRSHPELLLEPVARATERGVAVRILVRQRNAYPEQMDGLLALHDLGVEVLADTRNHAKVAIADSIRAVIFSANFDAKHGLDSGVEVGVYTGDANVVGEAVRYIEHAIDQANTRFLRDPRQRDLDGTLAGKWCSKWRGPSTLELDSENWRRFATHSANGPVLFEASDELSLRLHAGRATFEWQKTGDRWSEGRLVASSTPNSSRVLEEWLGLVRPGSTDGVDRGFCTARVLTKT